MQVAGTPLWVATFAPDEFATSGHVAQGFMITIAGTDEHGAVRTWIIAKGDVDVMAGDAAPVSGGSYYAVKLRDTAPENPVEGDAYVSAGALLIYHDGEWVTIGGVDISGKLDGAAAYPAWEAGPYGENSIVSHNGKLWKCLLATTMEPPSEDWVEVTLQSLLAAKQDALSQSQLAAVNSGATSAKVATWDGYAAQIAQKANTADLPYRLVEPGAWEFSDGLNRQLTGPIFDGEEVWYYYTNDNLTSQDFNTEAEASAALSLLFGDSLTATRPSLPGHLLDRAGNRVVVSGDTTLTLPALEHAGRLRDFVVRLEISGSTVPTITFAAPTGETIVYETDGDEFPVPDEAGTWSYSFTESCVAHKFAVSLKKVTTVAQGGS